MLTSLRLTDRVRLWDTYTESPVNTHNIKVDFLKKVHRKNPLFRLQVKHPRKHRMKVTLAL